MRRNVRLVLSSSFPRFDGDYSGAFVARHMDFLSAAGVATVICPSDGLVDKSFDASRPYRVVRFPSPTGIFYGDGGPENIRAGGAALYPRALLACSAMLAAAMPHLIHANGISAHWALPAGLTGMLLKKISGLPLQLIIHGGAAQILLESLPGRLLLRNIILSADDLVFVSEVLRRRVLDALPSAEREKAQTASRIVPMGVDGAQFRRTDGLPAAVLENRRVLFLGRLAPIKGADILLKALASAKCACNPTLAGHGSQAGFLEDLSAELGVEAEFTGKIDYRKRAELFRECPVFVLPSRRLKDGRVEGAPQVLLEAMSAGACVIAADCGGVREMLNDGEYGLLFANENAEQLGDLLNKALQNGALRRNLGEKALGAAAKFDWEKIGRTLCEGPGRKTE